MNYYLNIVFLALLLSGYSTSATSKSSPPTRLLIKNITVVSAQLDNPIPNTDVYVTGNIISKIGKNLNVDAKQIIDGTGLYLTPGLIDAHTHLDGVPGMSFKDMQENPKIVEDTNEQIPKSYLYHGFTTLIDLHSNSEIINSWNNKSTRPTAYFCGAAPVIDGYPMSFIPKPLRYQIIPYFLLGDNRG